jgi:hypothetical protein
VNESARLTSTVNGRVIDVRKQYHFWRGDNGLDAWDDDLLFTLCAVLPVEVLRLADIPEVDSVYWFDDEHPATVRSVAVHVQLTNEVDTSHPIIVGPDGRVMDGMHRIIRALLDGRETIAARRLPALPEPDYRDCRPEDLPYPQ